ncbi:MAG: methionyl-tRNA formyltransferase [Candidatus Promineifilaceae bacterium]
MSIRVVFWGNSQSVFSARHFDALLNDSCQLVAVVDVPITRRDSTNPLPAGLPNFVDAAQRQGIPAMAPAYPEESHFLAKMNSLAPDLFVAAGYSLILGPPILSVPRLLAANFHASLLPDYRGKHPVFWTLRGDELWAGLTIHVMDPGIDTGAIIYQVKVRTRLDDTVSTLYDRIMERSTPLVGRLLTDAANDSVPQRAQPASGGSYFSSTSEEDFRIDWTWPAAKIRRHILMTPGRCFATIAGQRLYLARAEVVQDQQSSPPGTLVTLGKTRCLVAVGDGAVWLGRVRWAGCDEDSMASLCRQAGLTAGEMLI